MREEEGLKSISCCGCHKRSVFEKVCLSLIMTVDFIVENYELNRASGLMPHRARGCPFITNVDGEDFVVDGITKYDGYGDKCKTIYFAGVAIFQDVEEKIFFPFCFDYSYETDEYKCYSKHFSDEIVEDEFAYFIVENYERSCRNVKEVLKRRE
ncbi:unnamed protein product [Bathycoccus prasinos]